MPQLNDEQQKKLNEMTPEMKELWIDLEVISCSSTHIARDGVEYLVIYRSEDDTLDNAHWAALRKALRAVGHSIVKLVTLMDGNMKALSISYYTSITRFDSEIASYLYNQMVEEVCEDKYYEDESDSDE